MPILKATSWRDRGPVLIEPIGPASLVWFMTLRSTFPLYQTNRKRGIIWSNKCAFTSNNKLWIVLRAWHQHCFLKVKGNWISQNGLQMIKSKSENDEIQLKFIQPDNKTLPNNEVHNSYLIQPIISVHSTHITTFGIMSPDNSYRQFLLHAILQLNNRMHSH